MARRSPRSRRQHSNNGSAHKYIVGVVIFIAIGILFGSAFLRANAPKYDPQTLCAQSQPSRVTVILVDATDSLNAVQRASIANQIDNIVDTLKEGERVELFSVSDDVDLLTPLFDRCRPGDGSNANIVISNPEKLWEKYRSEFVGPLQQAFHDLIIDEQSESTPLMRAIQAASVKGFGKWPATTERRLIIISDMLEYDGERNHYQLSQIRNKNFDNAEFARLRTDLKGASVELWYLRRNTKSNVQGSDHIAFWQAYVAHLNGVITRVYSVEG